MLTLFNFCCKEIPNPEPEIYQAIRELHSMNYFVEGKVLFKDEILQNPKRNQMYEHISIYPGAHERELRRVFNLGAYGAHIHLAFLMGYGFIRKSVYKNRNVYFLVDFDEAIELKTLLLRDETNTKIYECIKAREQIRLTEISDILQIPYTTIQSHLKELEDGALVKKIQRDQISYYVLAETEISTEITSQQERVEVKREYDYVGGKIRFKVAVRNYTNLAIHNISVNLNPSDQFITDFPMQTIANLPPNSTRGIDFDLVPLTCGQSKVFGAISFEDAYGTAHSLTIQPKEIRIKCPLVTPLFASQDEVDAWIKNLKKGSHRIPYQDVSDAEAFRIGREQVSALDLREIKFNEEEMWGLFLGQVKVTGKSTVVKVSVAQQNIILEVWADDLKQTTGFLAYITNLVNIALEMSYKIARRTEDITRKISNLMQISKLADETFTCCHELGLIQDITGLLSKMQNLLQESLPDSFLIQAIQIWNSKLTGMFEPMVALDQSISFELQYKSITWLYKIHELIKDHVRMYQDAFKDLSQVSNNFSAGLDVISQRIAEHEKIYGLGILSFILIIENKSGLALFERNFGDLQINADLISGFLQALQGFGHELSRSETSMKTLTYENYQFQIESGDYIRTALILRGPPNQFLISRLQHFVRQLEQDFKEEIIHFTGNTEPLETINDLFEVIFR